MSNSCRNNGAKAPARPSPLSETVPHVLLKHDCQKTPPCATDYCVVPLQWYCKHSPKFPVWRFLGVYPSEASAQAKMDDESDALKFLRKQFGPGIDRLLRYEPSKLTPEERDQIRELGKPRGAK